MEDIFEVVKESEKLFYVRFLRIKKVCNMCVDELYVNFEEIKVCFRFGIEWKNVYFFNFENLFGVEVYFDYDIYLVVGDGFRKVMKFFFDVDFGENFFVFRKLMN